MLWEDLAQRDALIAREDRFSPHIRAIYLRDELAATSARREYINPAVLILLDSDNLRNALLPSGHHRSDGARFSAESHA
jgi:hypothetical protein